MQQSNRLPTLAAEARQAHAESLHHSQKAADRALVAGSALVEAKALCAHGTWGDWLAQTGIPERSAQRYMKLHRAGITSAMVADLGGIAEAERVVASQARIKRCLDRIAASEAEKREGWLQYGRALNEARTLLSDDEEFEAWIAANGLGQASPSERAAAMQAAREEMEAVR